MLKTGDVVRLEVETDPVGLVNLIANPNGEFGGWGWVSPVVNSRVRGGVPTPLSPYFVIFERFSGTASTYFTTEDMPLAAGEYVAARALHAAGAQMTLSFEFLNASKSVISTSTPSTKVAGGAPATPIARSYPATVAPATTAYVRLRVDMYSALGATPGPGALIYLTEVTVAKAATSGALAGLSYIAPVPYVDILGDVSEIAATREELNVGTLTLTTTNPDLDPAIADTIRPGRRFRLMALNPATAVYEPLIAGKLNNAKVDYDPIQPDADRRARITVTGSDNVTALANAQRPQSVGTLSELPYVLEGCGVPWDVNGSGSHVASATVVLENDNASALDQVALTRDTALAYGWMDRWGVLRVYDSTPTATPIPLSETEYNPGIVIDYDTDRCINSVLVRRQWTHASEGPQETVYGPYEDAASVADWGRHTADFNVAGTDPASIPAYAAAILAANAVPQVRVLQVEIPIEDDLSLAFLDLYDAVQVTNDDLGIDTVLRITGIKHAMQARVEGDRWLVTLTFAADGGVAQPTQQPPLQGTTAVIRNGLVYTATGVHSASIANATITTVGSGWSSPDPVGSGAGAMFSAYSAGVWTMAVAGTYLINASMTWASNGTGNRMTILYVNGAEVRRSAVGAGGADTVEVSHLITLATGDTVNVRIYQTSGAALALTTTPGHHFQMTRIGD